MDRKALDALRDDLIVFLGAQRHGAITKMAKALGVSRVHLTNFRDGGDVSDELAGKIARLVREEQVCDDPMGIILQELENVIRILRCPSFEDDFKVDCFFNRIMELNSAQVSIRRAIQRAKEAH